jgi:hypothetical protein
MRSCANRNVAVPVGPREFITAWQGSNSVAEVAQKVRAKKNAVRVRAMRYRRHGIPLKQFPPVEVELPDWDVLARYAAELIGETTDRGQQLGETPAELSD